MTHDDALTAISHHLTGLRRDSIACNGGGYATPDEYLAEGAVDWASELGWSFAEIVSNPSGAVADVRSEMNAQPEDDGLDYPDYVE